MINSRKLDDLHPIVKDLCEKFLAKCAEAGVDLLVTSTYRDNESQDALYAQGRTLPGTKVTNAKGGQSYHNYKIAFDVVPIVNGKAMWNNNSPSWNIIGKIGVDLGLEWAGNWKTFKEYPHFQYTGGLSLAQLQAGEKIGEKK